MQSWEITLTEGIERLTNQGEIHGVLSNLETMKPPAKSLGKLGTGKIVLIKHKKKDQNFSTSISMAISRLL